FRHPGGIARNKRFLVGGGAAVESLADLAHAFRDGAVADAHFAKGTVHVGAEKIEDRLPGRDRLRSTGTQSADHENAVEEDHLEAALQGVGDDDTGIKAV